MRLIMGEPLWRARRRSTFPHPCFYAEAVLAPGAVLPLDPDYDERAVYVVSGEIDIAGASLGAGRLLVFRPGDRISILAVSHGTPDAARRRADGRPAPHLVELRLVLEGPHRRGQGRLEGQALQPVPGDEEEFIPLPA